LAVAFTLRGDAFFRNRGKIDEAIADYSQAVRLNGKNVNAWLGLCKSRLVKKDHDQAIADCTTTIALSPKLASAWVYRGDAYSHKLDGVEQALFNYDEAIKLDPNWMWPYINRGSLLQLNGQLDRAIADYSEAIRLSPDYAVGWADRCEAYASIGKFVEALTDCNKALSAKYMIEASILDSRAFAYFKMGQLEKANADYNAALKLDPMKARSLYSRGLAKLKGGDTIGGNKDIEVAKELKLDLKEQSARYGVQANRHDQKKLQP
jgi:tetratricopeptide (TPR) repeat protein